MSIHISAVICTLNRADYLRKALQSLVAQTLPKEEYEILVIDNGSTDNTRNVVCDEFKSVGNLRYVREPTLGLSQARNTGSRSAKGDYVAFLDDDAVASTNWLGKILQVFETVKPKPGCVGGKVEPIWEAPRPPWLSENMIGYLTTLDLSTTLISLNNSQWLAGTNMAFPRDLLETVSGFQANLGRKGSRLLSMEEILLQRQLQSRGHSCLYHPEIVVKHHVPPARLTQKWFLRRVYWQGVSDALVQIHRESLSPMSRLGMGNRRAGNILLSPGRLFNLAVPTNHPDRFTLKCSTVQAIGYVSGLFGITG